VLVCERLDALDALRDAAAVALFWPIEQKHEVDLRPLDGRLRARGVKVAYPATERETGAMQLPARPSASEGSGMMKFRFVTAPETMVAAPMGLREPSPSEPEAREGELAVIVVPALAVDPTGHRIGYGAGYYDRALPRYAPPAFTVAVAFDYQLVPEVPATDGDVAVACVVTDRRTLFV
jgi:5-formyltetrahydrofolate cyclo-ligase